LFTWVWAFTKKLWGIGALYLIVSSIVNNIIFSLLDSYNPSVMAIIIFFSISIIINVIAGTSGNGWLKNSLKKRGFKILEYSNASSNDAAISEFLARKNEATSSEVDDPEQVTNEGKVRSSMRLDIDENSEDDYSLYQIISDELESNQMDMPIWTQALALADGDNEKQKANYIKLRLKKLKMNSQ